MVILFSFLCGSVVVVAAVVSCFANNGGLIKLPTDNSSMSIESCSTSLDWMRSNFFKCHWIWKGYEIHIAF